jgi:hypothetical protein
MLTTLIVIVTAVGGPLNAQRRRAPDAPMPGSLIEVAAAPSTGLTATSRFGSLELELERGTYTVTARLGPGERQCGTVKRIRLDGQRQIQVHLFCSIP